MVETVREKRRVIAAGEVLARYETAGFSRPDVLDFAVDEMLDLIARQESLLDDLQDGMQFRFGWSILTLRAAEDGFVLWEPDFSLADPRAALVEHVTVTAQLAAIHWYLGVRTGLPSAPCLFTETIVVREGALDAAEVVLVHDDKLSERHSGWVVMPQGMEAAGALQEMPTYLLLVARPHLLKALGLPEGCIVTMRGDDVVAVRDADSNDCLGDMEGSWEPIWVAAEC